MDILSIVFGVLALVTAFTPLIWLQVVGGFVGIAGIVLARKAKKADYRKEGEEGRLPQEPHHGDRDAVLHNGRAAVLSHAGALGREQHRTVFHDSLGARLGISIGNVMSPIERTFP